MPVPPAASADALTALLTPFTPLLSLLGGSKPHICELNNHLAQRFLSPKFRPN
jgi:hypothetical protein